MTSHNMDENDNFDHNHHNNHHHHQVVSHLYSVPNSSSSQNNNRQQQPTFQETHHFQNNNTTPCNNNTPASQNFQLFTFPNSDLPSNMIDGRNFQVFSLSSDQLQSEATKEQIKSLLNLEPENEEEILPKNNESISKPLKMSETINSCQKPQNSTETSQKTPANNTSTSNTSSTQQKPLLVNAKQYQRILKRREQREKLIRLGLIPKHRKKYLHESRHRHAMMRNRSEGGRFNRGSTKTKLQALRNCEERRKLKEMQEEEEEIDSNGE